MSRLVIEDTGAPPASGGAGGQSLVDCEIALGHAMEALERSEALVRELLPDAVPASALRCPRCGSTVKWSCAAGRYFTGRADCENGRQVSRRIRPTPEPCDWPGTRVVRLPLGGVVAPNPKE